MQFVLISKSVLTASSSRRRWTMINTPNCAPSIPTTQCMPKTTLLDHVGLPVWFWDELEAVCLQFSWMMDVSGEDMWINYEPVSCLLHPPSMILLHQSLFFHEGRRKMIGASLVPVRTTNLNSQRIKANLWTILQTQTFADQRAPTINPLATDSTITNCCDCLVELRVYDIDNNWWTGWMFLKCSWTVVQSFDLLLEILRSNC